jgi:hypothetical protein
MNTKLHFAEADRIQSEIKRAALRQQHCVWSEEQVLARVRRFFATGYLGEEC